MLMGHTGRQYCIDTGTAASMLKLLRSLKIDNFVFILIHPSYNSIFIKKGWLQHVHLPPWSCDLLLHHIHHESTQLPTTSPTLSMPSAEWLLAFELSLQRPLENGVHQSIFLTVLSHLRMPILHQRSTSAGQQAHLRWTVQHNITYLNGNFYWGREKAEIKCLE